jgi:succinyl-diaminopimelate desuccinylase
VSNFAICGGVNINFFACIMIDKILDLSKKLIAIKTDPDNAPALSEALDIIVGELEDFTVEKFEANGAKSILAYFGSVRPEKFKVILNGHLDVIPGKDLQYKARIEGDKMFGVGSMDMKSNVVCMLEVFKDLALKLKYPIALQIVTDEEIGGFDGTKFQIDEGVRADFVIAGETTQFDIVNQARGVLQLKITAKGKTAHGAYPWRGENAIEKINDFINNLQEKFPNPEIETWKTSINIASIDVSNKSYNKIPDFATLLLDIRFIPEDAKDILERIKNIVPDDFEVDVIVNESCLFVESDDYFIKQIQKATLKVLSKDSICYGAYGTSDARFYTAIGAKGVEFGPVGGGIGTDDEWVSIKGLVNFYSVLVEFLNSLD